MGGAGDGALTGHFVKRTSQRAIVATADNFPPAADSAPAANDID